METAGLEIQLSHLILEASKGFASAVCRMEMRAQPALGKLLNMGRNKLLQPQNL
jgi:hypothetical protein